MKRTIFLGCLLGLVVGMTSCENALDKQNNKVFEERWSAYALYLTHNYTAGDSVTFVDEQNDTLRFCVQNVLDQGIATNLEIANYNKRYEELWSIVVLQRDTTTIELALGTAFAENEKTLENYAGFVYAENGAIAISKNDIATLGSLVAFDFNALTNTAKFRCPSTKTDRNIKAWSFSVEKEKGIGAISYTLPATSTDGTSTHTLTVVP